MVFVFVLVWVKLFGCLDLLVFVLKVGFDVCFLYVLMLVVDCFCCFSVYVCAATLFYLLRLIVLLCYTVYVCVLLLVVSLFVCVVCFLLVWC